MTTLLISMVGDVVTTCHHSDKPGVIRIPMCTHTGIYNVLYNMVSIWLGALVLKEQTRWCLWHENAQQPERLASSAVQCQEACQSAS